MQMTGESILLSQSTGLTLHINYGTFGFQNGRETKSTHCKLLYVYCHNTLYVPTSPCYIIVRHKGTLYICMELARVVVSSTELYIIIKSREMVLRSHPKLFHIFLPMKNICCPRAYKFLFRLRPVCMCNGCTTHKYNNNTLSMCFLFASKWAWKSGLFFPNNKINLL